MSSTQSYTQSYIPIKPAPNSSSRPKRPSPSAFGSPQVLQSPPRLLALPGSSSPMMQGGRANPELDQLEQIADEIEQLHKRKMSDALADLGYSSIVTSGFYARRAQASSPPKFSPPPPIIASGGGSGLVAKRRLDRSCPAALPDSPRVDTFGR